LKEISEYVRYRIYVMCLCCLNDLGWLLLLHTEYLFNVSVPMILKT